MLNARKSPRYSATQLPPLQADIVAGPQVEIVNVSRGGLLLHCDVRLNPGNGVCLKVTVRDQVYLLAGRICRVDAALFGGAVKYRAGVALDQETNIFDSLLAEAGTSLGEAGISGGPEPTGAPNAAGAGWQEHDDGFSSCEVEPLRTELALERRRAEQLQSALDLATAAIRSAETHRADQLQAHASAQATWLEEQRSLEARMRDMETRAAETARELDALRDHERRLLRQHEQDRAALDLAVREGALKRVELEAEHAAAFTAITYRLEAHQREREDWIARHERLASQLQKTENWCASQQDLLYRIREELGRAFSLLDMDAQLLLKVPPTPPGDRNGSEAPVDRQHDASFGAGWPPSRSPALAVSPPQTELSGVSPGAA